MRHDVVRRIAVWYHPREHIYFYGFRVAVVQIAVTRLQNTVGNDHAASPRREGMPR